MKSIVIQSQRTRSATIDERSQHHAYLDVFDALYVISILQVASMKCISVHHVSAAVCKISNRSKWDSDENGSFPAAIQNANAESTIYWGIVRVILLWRTLLSGCVCTKGEEYKPVYYI